MAYTMVYRAGHRETRITELGYNEERGCWQYSENFGDSAYTDDITKDRALKLLADIRYEARREDEIGARYKIEPTRVAELDKKLLALGVNPDDLPASRAEQTAVRV